MKLVRLFPATRVLSLSLALLLAASPLHEATACMAVGRLLKGSVVNADQTALIYWDKASGTEHFFRKASFVTSEQDVGFVIPTPSRPELAEAGNDVFPILADITAPTKYEKEMDIPFGCATTAGITLRQQVVVLETKLVAGFNATVLSAGSGEALNQWLKDNGYSSSPEVAEWSQYYADKGWFFTALKVARSPGSPSHEQIKAGSLRMSFKTDRPVFPYAEPDTSESAAKLGVKKRLLRVYFISDERYKAEFGSKKTWPGEVMCSRSVSYKKDDLLKAMGLEGTAHDGPWWLTEFEEKRPYRKTMEDIYFRPSFFQGEVERNFDKSKPYEEVPQQHWMPPPSRPLHTPATLGTEIIVGGCVLFSLQRPWRRRKGKAV